MRLAALWWVATPEMKKSSSRRPGLTAIIGTVSHGTACRLLAWCVHGTSSMLTW